MPLSSQNSLPDIQKPVIRVMSSPAICIEAGASVAEAASQMMIHGIGFLPVLADGGLVGAVTDRDLAIDILPKALDLARLPVRQIMRRNIMTCTAETTIEQAAHLMGRHQVRRLPVLSAGGAVLGVISVADIAVDVSEHLAGETLGEIAEDR